jgi:glycosyltransferase involved in cell wall biosynthesis
LGEGPVKAVAITICRDEFGLIQRSVSSVLRQTVKPATYVVVDDGSTDGTLEYLESLRGQITLLKTKRQKTQYGTHRLTQVLRGIREATRQVPSWTHLYKVDADAEVPANYFETLLEYMKADKRLGVVSGLPLSYSKGGWVDGYQNKSVQVNCWDSARLTRREAHELFKDLYGVYGWDSLFQLYLWFNRWKTLATSTVRFYDWRPQPQSKSLRKWVDMGVCRSRLGYGLRHQLISAFERRRFHPRNFGAFLFVTSYILHRLLGKRLMPKLYYKYTRESTYNDLVSRLKHRKHVHPFCKVLTSL